MSEETAGYIAKARQALRAAEVLKAEELWTDAVSRTYYAIFYAAIAALSSKTIFPKTHKGALLKFNEHFILSGDLPKEVGRIFSDTFEKRQTTDYTPHYQISPEEVDRLVKGASFFLESVQTLLQE